MRRRAWVALGEVLAALAKQRTIVLTIDDLQWSDMDSAQLLTKLVGSGQQTPLLVVILYRPAEAAANTADAGDVGLVEM
jgi:predicted ATPase